MGIQLAAKPKPQAIIPDEKEAFDLIIIGGGPAGLTAAIYALRFRLKTLMIENFIRIQAEPSRLFFMQI